MYKGRSWSAKVESLSLKLKQRVPSVVGAPSVYNKITSQCYISSVQCLLIFRTYCDVTNCLTKDISNKLTVIKIPVALICNLIYLYLFCCMLESFFSKSQNYLKKQNTGAITNYLNWFSSTLIFLV